jgi:hypothetical protein
MCDCDFCKSCGADIPPRPGEGTCPRCDPEGCKPKYIGDVSVPAAEAACEEYGLPVSNGHVEPMMQDVLDGWKRGLAP